MNAAKAYQMLEKFRGGDGSALDDLRAACVAEIVDIGGRA